MLPGAGRYTVDMVILLLLHTVAEAFCPTNCLCKHEILMVNCSQAGLSSIPILLNPRIRSLMLDNNLISEVTADALGIYAELETLDLSNNRIASVEPNAFSKLQKLKSLKLTNNHLSKVGPETFAGLNSVKVLHMGNNKLTRLPTAAFSDMSRLEVLSLSGNRLQSIAPAAFTGLGELNELHLKNNELVEMDDQPYKHLKKLKLLDLAGNSFVRVPARHFLGLNSLEVLNLADNEIELIDDDAFQDLRSMRNLHIDDNQLQRVPTLSFRTLSELESLTIGGNGFDEISTSAFEGLSRLRQLVITKCNRLRRVCLNGFSGLFALQTLVLTDNPELSEFDPLAFETDAPLAIQQVYLFGNNLTRLPKNLLPWQQLVELDIRDNPWHCDCSLSWIGPVVVGVANQAAAATGGNLDGYRIVLANGQCRSPAEMQHRALSELGQDGLACSNADDVSCVVSILLTTIFILCTLVLLFVCIYENVVTSSPVMQTIAAPILYKELAIV